MKKNSLRWTPLTEQMVYSEAYQDLSLSSRRVHEYVLLQRTMIKMKKPKKKKKEYVCTNHDEIVILYRDLLKPPFNMKNQSITRGIDGLLSNGFIIIIEQGGSVKGHYGKYSLSYKWKEWIPGQKPFSVRNPYIKKGFIKSKPEQKPFLVRNIYMRRSL